MKIFIVKALEVISYLGFFGFIVAGAVVVERIVLVFVHSLPTWWCREPSEARW
jgi:hypothetical protein